MKAQIQTRIKDSTLRMILPSNDSQHILTPRQNRIPCCNKIRELEEEHSPIRAFLADNKDHNPEESPLRKRGYSDVDQINFKELKLNMKASLQ